MDKYLLFSGDKPTLEDENFSRDALIQGILDRAKDHFTDGVVTGFVLSKVGALVKATAGVAYRGGERIASAVDSSADWPASDKYVFVSYTLTEGSPKTHHITGDPHNTRQVHGFALVLKDSSTPAAGEVLVGRAVVSPVSVVDLRTFCQVVADPRIHIQNTDTHTTAAEFRVDGAAGDIVLTTANAVTQHPELELLFRHGLINFQDGGGDRMIETHKVPSSPNAPVLDEADLSLKVISMAPDRSVAMRASLDSYLAAKVAAEALTEHLSLIESYRSLVNQKRLLGWTLDQIRGDTAVGGSVNLDVRNLKDEMIVAGAAGVDREPGTLALTSGSNQAVGTDTSMTTALNGKKILVFAAGLLKEYTISSVSVGDQKATLSTTAGETISGVWFYQCAVNELGFGSGVSDGAEMLIEVDGWRIGKEVAKEQLFAAKQAHGNTVLGLYTQDDTDQEDSYSMHLVWDKPALIDLEEIQRYRIRVYELDNSRSVMDQGISMDTLEGSHVDLIYRTTDLNTTERQKVEEVAATGTTDTGSTTTAVKLVSVTGFVAGTRVVVGGVSRTIKSIDVPGKTLHLLTALPSAPSASVAVSNYRIVWDGDVQTERYQRVVRPGQQLVIYAQAISEYGVSSPWSDGLVVLTDELEAGGKTLAALVAERMGLKKLRAEVERDQIALGYQDQILELKRTIALAATKADLDTAVAQIEALTP